MPADDLWGLDVFETEAALAAGAAKRSSTMIIGPAGEHQVICASVQLEKDHALGRGGLGAVFGSKGAQGHHGNLTGVDAAGSPAPPSPKCARRCRTSPPTRPRGQAYRRLGTPMMVAVLNEAGSFPTRYWESGRAPHREKLEAENYPSWAKVETGTCPPCPVRCRRHLTILEGPHAGREVHGPEYETLYSFGGLCMVESAEDVLLLHEECNRLGVDTMSVGNVIALAIKAGQDGVVDGAPALGDTAGDLAAAARHLRPARRSSATPWPEASAERRRRSAWRTRPSTSRAWSRPATTPAPCGAWPWPTPPAPGVPATCAPPSTSRSSPA